MIGLIKELYQHIRDERKAERERREEVASMIRNSSYKTLRVVGRGTVRIDPWEVAQTEKFQNAKKLARKIVNAQ